MRYAISEKEKTRLKYKIKGDKENKTGKGEEGKTERLGEEERQWK